MGSILGVRRILDGPMEGAGVPQLLRLQCFNVSSDGYGAGEGQSLDHPFGHATPSGMPTPQTCSRGPAPRPAG
jgi:hypothetical protein